MAYAHADNAIARCLGPVSEDGELTVTAGKGAAFAAGGPTPEAPLALGVWRSTGYRPIADLLPYGTEVLIGAVLVTAVDGDVLTIAGAPSGYTPPTIAEGDWISDAPIAGHQRATGGGGEPGPPGTAATLAIGTVTTLPAGSQATASNGGTSSAAILNLGLPTGATGAAGATGPGVPAGGSTGQVLAKSSGADLATAWITTGTVTSVALAVPSGFSASSPITTAGTLTISTALSGMLKGTGSGFAAATAGTDYVSPAGLTSALSAYATTSDLTAGLGGKEPTIAAGTTGQYRRGDNTWQALTTTAVATSLSGLLKGNGSAISAATAGADYVSPTGSGAGLTGLNASALATGTVPAARLATGTADGTKFVRDDGVLATPVAKRNRVYTWKTPADSAGAVGACKYSAYTEFACKVVSARVYAIVNPTSVFKGNVVVGGVNVLATDMATASGSTVPVAYTSGFAVSGTIPAGTLISAFISTGGIASDAREGTLQLEVLEV